MRRPPILISTAAALLALVALGGCERDAPAAERRVVAPPSTGERALVVAGELVAGPEHPMPTTRNPYEGDSRAMAEGSRLYTWFNCAGCHGVNGGGGMGPPLRDPGWIYGADPASVFQSIAQGRPNGMPTFGGRVPDDQIWKLVLYVRSIGGEPSRQRAGASGAASPTQPGTGGD